MVEKEVWTLDGRKKIYLVNERNQIIKEIKDLGPLNESERLWVRLRPGVPYREWLEDFKKEQENAKKKEIGRKNKTKGKRKHKKSKGNN